MRSGALRRNLILLALFAVLGGCSSVAKKKYLKHLSTTMSPIDRSIEPMAAAIAPDRTIAAANDR